MKPFVLALCLRMVRSGVIEADAQAQQPDAKAGVMTGKASAPGWSIVTGDRLGQPVTAKNFNDCRLGNRGRIGATSLQSDRETRVVVKYGERITVAARQLKLTLEIHLP